MESIFVKTDSKFDLFSVEASFMNKKENFALKPLIRLLISLESFHNDVQSLYNGNSIMYFFIFISSYEK